MSRATVVQIIAMVCIGWVVAVHLADAAHHQHEPAATITWRPATDVEQRQYERERLAEEKARLRELLRQQPRGPVAPGRTDDGH